MDRKTIFVIALMLGSASSASAQSAYAVSDLGPKERAYIIDYVLKERIRPAILEERISMGATVPLNVELQKVPADWAPSVQPFLYFISDDRVHLVEPKTRRVVFDIF